jgi:hypothetical protein
MEGRRTPNPVIQSRTIVMEERAGGREAESGGIAWNQIQTPRARGPFVWHSRPPRWLVKWNMSPLSILLDGEGVRDGIL